MAKKFKGPEIVKEIDDALNKGLARFLIITQGKLSAANPVDTGRMASSWFIGKGSPDRSVAPERDGPGPVKRHALQRADHHGLRLVDQQLAALCRAGCL